MPLACCHPERSEDLNFGAVSPESLLYEKCPTNRAATLSLARPSKKLKQHPAGASSLLFCNA
jgi:hypothetical protein